jgi:peptide methionine sulfoxide reductase MsrA
LLHIPPSIAIKADDIDVGSGYYNARRKLQKAKQSSEGNTVQEIENNLAKLDIKTATSIQEAQEIHQQYINNRLALRSFYNSKRWSD